MQPRGKRDERRAHTLVCTQLVDIVRDDISIHLQCFSFTPSCTIAHTAAMLSVRAAMREPALASYTPASAVACDVIIAATLVMALSRISYACAMRASG
jgi:hypothetical protein